MTGGRGKGPEAEFFRKVQIGLVNVVVGLGMFSLIREWPLLLEPPALGYFLASAVVLIHWHYGLTFALCHLGGSTNLVKLLADSSMLFLLLAVPLLVSQPVAWFWCMTAAFLIAVLEFQFAYEGRGATPAIRRYVTRKKLVDAAATLSCLGGALWAMAVPGHALLLGWAAFAGNLLGVFVIVYVMRLYDLP